MVPRDDKPTSPPLPDYRRGVPSLITRRETVGGSLLYRKDEFARRTSVRPLRGLSFPLARRLLGRRACSGNPVPFLAEQKGAACPPTAFGRGFPIKTFGNDRRVSKTTFLAQKPKIIRIFYFTIILLAFLPSVYYIIYKGVVKTPVIYSCFQPKYEGWFLSIVCPRFTSRYGR
jgi:hypothetical protein